MRHGTTGEGLLDYAPASLAALSRWPREVGRQGWSTSAGAIDNFRKRSFRPVSLTQLKVVLVGEEAARRGIDDLLDYLERNQEVQRRVKIAVVPGEALRILEVPVMIDQMVALALPRSIARAAVSARAPEASIGQTMTRRANDLSFVLPRVRPSDDGKELVVAGAGVFRDGRLVGWLGEDESRGLAWITGQVRDGALEFPCRLDRECHAALIAGVRRRLRVRLEHGRPVFQVSVLTRVDLLESAHPLDSPELLRREERAAAQVVRRQIEAALRAGRRLKVDLFGFRNALRASQPDVWDRVEKEWDDYFAREAKVEVTAVKVRLRHLGQVH